MRVYGSVEGNVLHDTVAVSEMQLAVMNGARVVRLQVNVRRLDALDNLIV